jgi:hypothetical protein
VQNNKTRVLFELDSIITTEAVFWVSVVISGSNLLIIKGRGVPDLCQRHCNANCLERRSSYLVTEPFWGYRKTEAKTRPAE